MDFRAEQTSLRNPYQLSTDNQNPNTSGHVYRMFQHVTSNIQEYREHQGQNAAQLASQVETVRSKTPRCQFDPRLKVLHAHQLDKHVAEVVEVLEGYG